MPIHRVPCQYIAMCGEKQQQRIGPLPLRSSLILLSSPLFWKSADWRRQGSSEHRSPSSSGGVWCDLSRVISAREKPWCIQEIIRATQAGFRGMQIFSECLKNNTTHTHTATPPNTKPPHPHPNHPHTHTHTHRASCTHSTTMRTHTYITQQRNTHKKTTTSPLTKLSPSAFA